MHFLIKKLARQLEDMKIAVNIERIIGHGPWVGTSTCCSLVLGGFIKILLFLLRGEDKYRSNFHKEKEKIG